MTLILLLYDCCLAWYACTSTISRVWWVLIPPDLTIRLLLLTEAPCKSETRRHDMAHLTHTCNANCEIFIPLHAVSASCLRRWNYPSLLLPPVPHLATMVFLVPMKQNAHPPMDRRKSGVTSRHIVLLACLGSKRKGWERMESWRLGMNLHHIIKTHLIDRPPKKPRGASMFRGTGITHTSVSLEKSGRRGWRYEIPTQDGPANAFVSRSCEM
jgi:hypothetical protein